jgi:hypothetical protein
MRPEIVVAYAAWMMEVNHTIDLTVNKSETLKTPLRRPLAFYHYRSLKN